jgi:DNA repair protein RadC
MKIKSLPSDTRPRERLIKKGSEALSNAELLSVILRTGNKKENVLELSNKILKKYNLLSLSRVRINNLKKISGMGETKACQIVACFELGRRLLSFRKELKPRIEKARDIAKLFMPHMANLKKEYFKGIYLDSRKRIIKEETIFIGNLNTSVIHPREIFQIAFNEGSAALILLHNHPSGDAWPSIDDIEITRQLVEAGEILGIEVLDHIIIGEKRYVSLKEQGFI